MRYLLDTNLIINLIRKKKSVDPKIFEEELFVSVITYAELFYGAYKSENKEKNFILIEEFLEDTHAELIGIDYNVAKIYGRVRRQLETKGQRLEDFDLLIAATALIHKLTLITGNIKHFARIEGLEVVS